ncbi:hypothetical protein B0H16DRAFT_1752991 [Mycena metata]|uniref:Uncharacterized protein n=1 Tax=Mycena metata TaxID=1033252 RepID=A0AAD7DDR4_9AGAR|nr:hypothetical protein B0H16DRAFT_1752991 [Mycena metata]
MTTHYQFLAPQASPRAAGAASVPAAVTSALVELGGTVDVLAAHTDAVSTAPLTEVPNALAGVAHAADAVHTALTALTAAINAAALFAAPSPAMPPVLSNFIRNSGPWIAGLLYSVIPSASLQAVPGNGSKWHAITRGKYVGLTQDLAISLSAVTGVSTGLREKFNTQVEALDHFNSVLNLNAVAIV